MQIASLTAAAALSGVYERVGATAAKVAQMASPEGGGDMVDLSAAAVSLLESKNEAAALTGVIKTANEMDAQVLNLLG